MSWLRWWDGTCSDPKWRVIAVRSGQPVGNIVAIWAWLLERARQADGNLGEIDAEEIAVTYGYEPEGVEAVLRALADKGLIEDSGIRNWRKRQPKREDDSRERVKAWREKQAEKPVTATQAEPRNASVTHGNAPEAEAETDIQLADANCPAEPAPKPAMSPKDLLWTDGVATLETMHIAAPKARSMIGKWLKDTAGDAGRVHWAIGEAAIHGSGDPIPYIARVLSDRPTGPPHRQANNRRSLADALHRIIPDEQPEQPSFPRLAFGG